MKFRNYINGFSKRNRIYSEEDLYKMMLEELLDNEESILSQNSMIGIPTNYELEESPNTEWIEKFVNSEGNPDGGYWQSILKPDFVPDINNYNQNKMNELDNYLNEPEEIPFDNELNNQNELAPEEDDLEDEKEETPILEGRVEYDEPTSLRSKYRGLSPISAIQKVFSKINPGDISAKNYYGISTRMADNDDMTDRVKDQNDFYKLSDIQDETQKDLYRQKMAQMYGVDVSDTNVQDRMEKTPIVVAKDDSKLNQQIKNSEAMQKWIAENYEKIKNGEIEKSSIEFPNGALGDEKDLYLTLHNADLNNIKIEDDSLSLDMLDGYDFANNYNPFVKNAYQQQEKGQLRNYLLGSHITYTKEELEEILKRLKKRK